MADEFEVDDRSSEQARRVTDGLRDAHEAESSRQILREYDWRESAASLTAPLNELSRDVPVGDLRDDLEDFAAVTAIARFQNDRIPALALGTSGHHVCILPPRGLLKASLKGFFQPYRFEWFRVLSDLAHDTPGYETTRQPVEMARETFFGAFASFLAVRIAGVRWLRDRGPQQPPAGSARTAAAAAAAVNPNGQWWTTQTKKKGLSLYYGGTHAIRNPPNYLAGFTSPLPVFLPVGTLHIAADAGKNGNYVWDPSVVTVPSMNPNFTTKRF